MVENVPPRQTWEALRSDPQAQLIDCRTDAEWSYVGLTDLSAAGKQPVLIPWQIFPAMQRNSAEKLIVTSWRTPWLTPWA